jgi:hypothetical protein
MSEYASESANPRYAKDQYPLSFGKYLAAGTHEDRTEGRVARAQQVGARTASTIENACASSTRRVGMLLRHRRDLHEQGTGSRTTAKYEYEEVADPFLADLGELVAREILK